MAAFTSKKTVVLSLGVPVAQTTGITFLGSGVTGTEGALRRLVHPTTSSFPPLVYADNPDRTRNFHKDVLPHPRTRAVLTEGDTKVFRFETLQRDTIVTEVWEGSEQRASMRASFFEKLFDLIANPPPFVPSSPVYVRWEPRDQTQFGYHVELLSLGVGPQGDPVGDPETIFDVKVRRDGGGTYGGGTYANASDTLDVVQTGLMDRSVALRMRIVERVTVP